MIVLELLIFPGFLFLLILSLINYAIDKKLYYFIQGKYGPHALQFLYDLVKLFKRETVVPKNITPTIFLISPLVSFSFLTTAAVIIIKSQLFLVPYAAGDLLTIFFLIIVSQVFSAIGGSIALSGASLSGFYRFQRKIISFWFPFFLAICFVIIKTGGKMDISGLINYQNENGFIIFSISGVLSFISFFLASIALISLNPYDFRENHEDIDGGLSAIYSGPPLAIAILTRSLMRTVIPFFCVFIYFGGINSKYGWVKYLIVTLIYGFINSVSKNTEKEDKLKIFTGIVSLLAVISVIMAYLGL